MRSEILKDLIKINTINDLENKSMRDYLKNILLPLGFSFEEFGDDNKSVLVAKRGNGNLGFVCHTDTVNSSPFWTYEPFKLTIDGDRMYGLGVADMKGGIAALINALMEIDNKYPVTIYFTYDEEINFEGMRKLLIRKEFPDILVFPEPTYNVPALANKGCLEFEVSFVGRSAHSSEPMKGDNAIYKAVSFINELKDYSESIKETKNDLYEIPYTTFNLGKIKGGDAINKVADNCQVSFDFRTIDRKQEKEIKTKINKLAKKYMASVNIINNLSSAMTESNEFKNIIMSICDAECMGLNYVTEASLIDNKKILILGPGPITAHQSDEYILRDSYDKIIEVYKKIIKELS